MVIVAGLHDQLKKKNIITELYNCYLKTRHIIIIPNIIILDYVFFFNHHIFKQ